MNRRTGNTLEPIGVIGRTQSTENLIPGKCAGPLEHTGSFGYAEEVVAQDGVMG